MRRLFGVLLAGAIVALPVFSQGAYAQEPQKFTLDGDLALWSVAIRPNGTGDYEQILRRVRDVLSKSSDPSARQQLAGWKVIRADKPMPDGNIVYTHVITPVRGADYSLLQILYSAITDRDEQEALFKQYQSAFDRNLALSSGRIAVDLSRP